LVAPAQALMAKRRSSGNNAKAPLRRRWWLNLALLLLVVTLALLAWYRPGAEKTDSRPLLSALHPETVQRIEIRERRQPTVVLERVEGRWRMTAPIKARANGFVVDSVAQLLRAPIEAPVGPAQGDLARYGLEQPALTVVLDDVAIAFGEMHPLKQQHYVRFGDSVSLLASRQYAQAARSYTGLIDSRLIEEGRQPIAFTLPGFTLALKDGTWQRLPDDEQLSSDRINAFVDEWRHARALNVRPADNKKTKERVTISFADGNALSIDIIARAPELVLRRADEGLDYRFPSEAANNLLSLRADSPK
jgi:hypothetical protein